MQVCPSVCPFVHDIVIGKKLDRMPEFVKKPDTFLFLYLAYITVRTLDL